MVKIKCIEQHQKDIQLLKFKNSFRQINGREPTKRNR